MRAGPDGRGEDRDVGGFCREAGETVREYRGDDRRSAYQVLVVGLAAENWFAGSIWFVSRTSFYSRPSYLPRVRGQSVPFSNPNTSNHRRTHTHAQGHKIGRDGIANRISRQPHHT